MTGEQNRSKRLSDNPERYAVEVTKTKFVSSYQTDKKPVDAIATDITNITYIKQETQIKLNL